MRRRRAKNFPPEVRAEAVRKVIEYGQAPLDAGIPIQADDSTVRCWLRQAGYYATGRGRKARWLPVVRPTPTPTTET